MMNLWNEQLCQLHPKQFSPKWPHAAIASSEQIFTTGSLSIKGFSIKLCFLSDLFCPLNQMKQEPLEDTKSSTASLMSGWNWPALSWQVWRQSFWIGVGKAVCALEIIIWLSPSLKCKDWQAALVNHYSFNTPLCQVLLQTKDKHKQYLKELADRFDTKTQSDQGPNSRWDGSRVIFENLELPQSSWQQEVGSELNKINRGCSLVLLLICLPSVPQGDSSSGLESFQGLDPYSFPSKYPCIQEVFVIHFLK